MGYYNRRTLFLNTLKTIKKSAIKDFEIIAVDDGSDPWQRLEDLQSQFPFLKVIRIEPDDKWYMNPCIPFNIGIREAKGDIIVLQNPECLHVHDVLSYINENLNNSNYLSISTYGLDSETNKSIPFHIKNKSLEDFIHKLPQRSIYGDVSLGWYNHPVFRPGYYHFCAAITRNNMAKLNGFDERYGFGIGYDDDEFLKRIRILGLQPSIVTDVSVIHQQHDTVYWAKMNSLQLAEVNKSLFINVTSKENNYHAPNTTELWVGN